MVIESTPVSVDVLAVRFAPDARAVLLGIAPRAHDPFAGELALPGVLLGVGERLAAAALRAVTRKLGVASAAVTGFGQLVTFDEPSRDPRGPTLSVALWATVDGARLDADAAPVRWESLDRVPHLAFDHDRIVDDCRPLLRDRLWRDPGFSAGLLGREFTTAQALDVTEALTGARPYPANLGRTLDRLPGLRRTEQRAAALPRGGRPPSVWNWDRDLPAQTP